jgi:hypothetical protein
MQKMLTNHVTPYLLGFLSICQMMHRMKYVIGASPKPPKKPSRPSKKKGKVADADDELRYPGKKPPQLRSGCLPSPKRTR